MPSKNDGKYFIAAATAVAIPLLALGAVRFIRGRKINSVLEAEKEQAERVYESRKYLDEYLLMHYGTEKELCPYDFGPKSALEFPRRCAEQCNNLELKTSNKGSKARVLDLGCAVGGASFHLARHFEHVVGLDFSQSFVNAANQIKEHGRMEYTYVEEGDITAKAELLIPADIDRERCTFVQGDACNLDVKALGTFEIVLGANLVCRLPDPAKFLASIGQLIVPGGYLVLPSPYTWLQNFTDKSKWIGGYINANGQPVRSFDGLKHHLKKDFEFVREENMPFFIKETARKHQWSVAHCTIWRRL
jgi:putative 4-mercaptohistidine N1-methyltranferase